MIDELCDLLRRETEAAERLEGRLRALELIVAADEQRFVMLALDEMDTAAEQLAALELSRVLVLTTAGISPDVTASQLVAGAADADEGQRLDVRVTELAAATTRLADARMRAQIIVANGNRSSRERMHAVNQFALH